MEPAKKVVAVNGSPHEAIGNTTRMVEMLRPGLEQEGVALDQVFLCSRRIQYCTGCAVCLDKGACWIRDDYRDVVENVLAADAVILASPVYVFTVTGQMKTFLDRSMGYGHRPRGTWKPGLSVSVSAGHGETGTARYLGDVLRFFGCFPVASFTAQAVGPGQFLGQDAVEARAADLARDLAAAIHSGRRQPATDRDLLFWNFMGGLVRGNRAVMRADHAHWEQLGLFESFERYVDQDRTKSDWDAPEVRKAWFKEMVAKRKQDCVRTLEDRHADRGRPS